MKLLITIQLVVVLMCGVSAGAAEWHADVQAARQQILYYRLNAYLAQGREAEALKALEKIKVVDPASPLGQRPERFRLNIEKLREQQPEEEDQGSWKQGFLFDDSASSSFFPIAADEEEKAGKAKGDEGGKGGPEEGALRRALAETRKQLEDVKKKIEDDHAFWKRSSEQMKESRDRIAELERSLARERQQFDKIRQSLARIERQHNGDHDREQALTAELEQREKALEATEGKGDKITRLEKQAAELRRHAEKLRRRAEELGKE